MITDSNQVSAEDLIRCAKLLDENDVSVGGRYLIGTGKQLNDLRQEQNMEAIFNSEAIYEVNLDTAEAYEIIL
jgi:nucleoside-diphosphate-sugar epimerase